MYREARLSPADGEVRELTIFEKLEEENKR
jgi:hypothetical protein